MKEIPQIESRVVFVHTTCAARKKTMEVLQKQRFRIREVLGEEEFYADFKFQSGLTEHDFCRPKKTLRKVYLTAINTWLGEHNQQQIPVSSAAIEHELLLAALTLSSLGSKKGVNI